MIDCKSLLLALVLSLCVVQPAPAMDLPLSIVPVLAATQGVDGSSLVAVDPYVESVVFFEDVNNNGVQDVGEQGSSTSDASGQCGFDAKLSVGSTIVASIAGVHNGLPYSLTLKRKVERGMESPIVISPPTTLAADDLTAAQVADMLAAAGLADITAGMITEDPMSGMDAITGSVTEAQLLRLRASIATYVFMRIRAGSDALASLSGAELYASGMDTDDTPGALHTILSTAVSVISQALSPAALAAAQATVSSYTGAPAISSLDIVQTAVTVADRLALVGYTRCNDTGGNYGSAVGLVSDTWTAYNASWIDPLAMRYYGYRNSVFFKGLAQVIYNSLPADIRAGVESDTGVWWIDDNEAIVELGAPN